MITNKSDKKKYVFTMMIFMPVLIAILTICVVIPNLKGKEDNAKQQSIEHEKYLLSQMQTIENKYNIVERNNKEIVLKNHSLGSVSIYDKNGTARHGFTIENETIYHN